MNVSIVFKEMRWGNAVKIYQQLETVRTPQENPILYDLDLYKQINFRF